MKKLIVFAFLTLGLVQVSGHTDQGNRHRHERLIEDKNISTDKLPKSVTKYLGENYKDYAIVLSRLNDNGNYYVKISFDGGGNRIFYRSLVFDSIGNLVKG